VFLFLYRLLFLLLTPLILVVMLIRLYRKKETAKSFIQKFGFYKNQPVNTLFIAASIGEANSILPLMKDGDGVATGTISSASLLQSKNHRFVPIDNVFAVNNFLKAANPKKVVFVESELWVNLISTVHKKNIPLFLVNGRVSDKSFEQYSRIPFYKTILSYFKTILAQSEKMQQRYIELGGKDVRYLGNLKFMQPPLLYDAVELTKLKTEIAGRPVFVFASTHHPEEEVAIQTHAILKKSHPNLLTVICPRHPVRQLEIIYKRSNGDSMLNSDIYLWDTFGEMGLLYNLSSVAFIGGSISDRGGQNPIEAAQLGVKIITGSKVRNFMEVYEQLKPEYANTPNEIAQSFIKLQTISKDYNLPISNLALIKQLL
jgi:3-deoxy-D-manno-octulosonic-acid transferase